MENLQGNTVLTSKTRAIDILHPVVWDQEFLLPSHEHGTSVGIAHGQVRLPQFLPDMSESRETTPMHHILLFTGSPVSSQESIPTPNDFSIKVRGQFRPVVCQTANAKVTTQV